MVYSNTFVNCSKQSEENKLCCAFLIGWLDYIRGMSLGFFIFYFIPAAISAWYCGKRDGICIAIVSALCWYHL
jgi:hypothetical protein